ncbi:MAG: hypothetical protein R2788_08120 [Saprospiraceae bacterium]
MITLLDYIVVNGAPTADFTFSVGGSDVSFNSQVDNFNTVEWDFGDSTTSANLTQRIRTPKMVLTP